MISDVENQISNPNLLINWDFRNPVNQRRKKEYNIYGYCLDRWIYYGEEGQTLKIEDDHIVIDGSGLDYTNGIFQTPEFPSTYSGKIVTFSVKYRGDGGTIRCYSRELAKEIGGKSMPKTDDWSIAFVTFEIPQLANDTKRLEFQINAMATKKIEIQSAKLEVGARSTLRMDEKANYGEQLALCQRYYLRINGYGRGIIGFSAKRGMTNQMMVSIPTPVTMRKTPEINFKDLKLFTTGPLVTEISGINTLENTIVFTATHPTDGMVDGDVLCVHISSTDGFIEFNAEL